jgi:hypothetical protein
MLIFITIYLYIVVTSVETVWTKVYRGRKYHHAPATEINNPYQLR